ncbi:unnamed protein product [Bursaphelenchus xylophilus]|uniref:(pine wood nematode) hypothetical protein n=1 Tax=Bursaphelenchus xylophilus TaxID=6326 RepID=A0A1I7SBH9_BURXY|nr:unnamed protein product [Bursaphelenchus xylophilus]CAG9121982.1 unnamed protein product [Bursaphelenchus xylophilus]
MDRIKKHSAPRVFCPQAPTFFDVTFNMAIFWGADSPGVTKVVWIVRAVTSPNEGRWVESEECGGYSGSGENNTEMTQNTEVKG